MERDGFNYKDNYKQMGDVNKEAFHKRARDQYLAIAF